MNLNLTRIAAVLDRSGSMSGLRSATVSGFNEYIGKLRTQSGEVRLLLARFDDEYEIVFDHHLASIPTLTDDDLVPRGTTALFDAIGRTVVKLGEELKAMPDEDRPGKVIVMVMTDGLENASQEYGRARVAELIKQQREQYNWDFLFFGTNQDAVLTASTLNIPAGTTLSYSSNAVGTRNVMFAAASASNVMRSHGATGQSNASYAFTDDMRKSALADDSTMLSNDPTLLSNDLKGATSHDPLRRVRVGVAGRGGTTTGGLVDNTGLTASDPWANLQTTTTTSP